MKSARLLINAWLLRVAHRPVVSVWHRGAVRLGIRSDQDGRVDCVSAEHEYSYR